MITLKVCVQILSLCSQLKGRGDLSDKNQESFFFKYEIKILNYKNVR
jgi:hypothetical protein